jgi:hypothetical protein
VQGRLRNEYLTVAIDTFCSASGQLLQIEVDSQLCYHVQPEAARPLVFTPHIEWESFRAPNIIDAY